ncbi:Putative NAD(P)H nitroreductase HI_1542 [Enhydrobacter sp. 8BJ]|nr:nitroreductase [Enhydrobacter sp. 8BJ]VXB74217.1 Putative NAD(P)H nitroreductase HI_1542 [Enhydrobacter sp. 8BJ]
MTNSEILDFIKSRRSIGNLVAPAPNREQVEQAIEVALSAPDHKDLNPYRFIVLENQALNTLGTALKNAAMAQGETDEKTLKKAENMPLRAPMIIACVTDFKPHDKVPHWEQIAASSCAVQNLLLALSAQGFATVWRTGPLANAPAIKHLFNVTADNQVIAFVYVGTAVSTIPPRSKIDVTPFIVYDNGTNQRLK